MLRFINYRMRIVMQDSRILVGQFLAFDRHMNLVLSGTEEFRKVIPKGKSKSEEKEEKRVLGLILLRGEAVISLSVEGPPPGDDNRLKPKVPQTAANLGKSQPQSRAIPLSQTTQVAPALVAPVRGVGGPAPMMMGRAAPPPIQRMPMPNRGPQGMMPMPNRGPQGMMRPPQRQ